MHNKKYIFLQYILPLMLPVGVFAWGIIHVIINVDPDNTYQAYLDNYFASSEYLIRGKISTRKFLGGCTFLSKIDVDSVSLVSTIDSKDMDRAPFRNISTSKPYVGICNQRLGFVYFLADNCDWVQKDSNWTTCEDPNWIDSRGVERPLLPINITIDSKLRKVFYETPDTVYEIDLCPDDIYTKYLEKYKKNVEYDYDESVRF
ncbi:MAG: hypothetical protein II951_09380 [Bacteroidales bacterium]|nr:hypothetical protein [Bacteroidales bacterium]